MHPIPEKVWCGRKGKRKILRGARSTDSKKRKTELPRRATVGKKKKMARNKGLL